MGSSITFVTDGRRYRCTSCEIDFDGKEDINILKHLEDHAKTGHLADAMTVVDVFTLPGLRIDD